MTCYCKKCKLEKPPPEDLVSKTAEPANRAPDHAVPDLKKACVGEPQLPRRFDSVPEVRTYILAVLVHKYDLGYDEAKAVADKWHLAMGGRLLDMRRQDLGHIFGDEIGRALRDTISYQTKELKEHRKFVKYVICFSLLSVLFAVGLRLSMYIAAIFIPLIIQLSLFIGAPNNNSREVPKPGVIITSIAATVLLAAQFWPVGMQALKFLIATSAASIMLAIGAVPVKELLKWFGNSLEAGMAAFDKMLAATEKILDAGMAASDKMLAATEKILDAEMAEFDKTFVATEKILDAEMAELDKTFAATEKILDAKMAELDKTFAATEKILDAKMAELDKTFAATEKILDAKMAELDKTMAATVKRLDAGMLRTRK